MIPLINLILDPKYFPKSWEVNKSKTSKTYFLYKDWYTSASCKSIEIFLAKDKIYNFYIFYDSFIKNNMLIRKVIILYFIPILREKNAFNCKFLQKIS